jgi:hypothetical protein
MEATTKVEERRVVMTLPPNNPAVESGEPSRAMNAVRHAIWRNIDSAMIFMGWKVHPIANSPNPMLSD